MAIDTVIFDIGGVLTDYTEQRFYLGLGYTPEMAERLYSATMASGHWYQWDLGNLCSRQVIDLFCQTDPEIAPEIRSSLRDLSKMVLPKEAAIPWIQGLRSRGYRVLYLSNFSEQCHRQCHEALAFVDETDGGIFSFQNHLIKPHLDMYQDLIQRFQLQPDHCVFLDDSPVNLPPAQSLGIHTIHYRNQQQAEAELDQLLKAEG